MYTAAWILFILAFFAIEIPALLNSRSGDTLSEHLWMWFGLDKEGRKKKTGWVRLRRFAALSILVWIAVHILSGGWI